MTTTFNRNMLPLLGVSWRRFPTLAEAKKFASWAERETKTNAHPCEAEIIRDDDLKAWEVKVSNW